MEQHNQAVNEIRDSLQFKIDGRVFKNLPTDENSLNPSARLATYNGVLTCILYVGQNYQYSNQELVVICSKHPLRVMPEPS